MAFTFTNYAGIQPQESPFADIIGKVLGGYGDMTKAKYLQPGLEEELKKSKLFNQYYGPNMESEIGLRGAQAGEAGARTGLIGEQTRNAHMMNKYYPQQREYELQSLNMKALQDKMMTDALRARMQEQMGGKPQMHPQLPNYMPGQGNAPFAQQYQQPQYQQLQTAQSNHPSIDDMINKKMYGIDTFTPNYKAQLELQNAQQKSRNEVLGKEDAKKISHLEDQALSGYQKQETFSALNQDLGSEAFEAMRQHPELGRHELAWFEKFGTPEQQEMIGRMRTHMGNIIKDSSRDFAGQFRVGEQALLNSMKPNESDSLGTMKGKAEALTYMNELLTKRSEMEADLMRNYNMSALQARVAANRKINPEDIKKEIRTILHPASSSKITPDQARAELERRRAGGK